MSAATEPQAGWIQSQQDFLNSLESTEGHNKFPRFPKVEAQNLLAKKFRLESSDIALNYKGKKSLDTISSEMGSTLLVQPMLMQPIDSGSFYYVTTEEDLQELMVAVFADNSLASYFYEKDKLLGFHYYFVAEMSRVLQNLQWIPSASWKLAGDAIFSLRSLADSGEVHVIDVTCRLGEKQFMFNLLLPEAMMVNLDKFFDEIDIPFDVKRINQTLPLTVSIELGHCNISNEEWSAVVPGSFIVLDSCMFDPDTDDCSAIVTIKGNSFFGGRFENLNTGEFKITTYTNNISGSENNDSNPGIQRLAIEVARSSLTVQDFIKIMPGYTFNLGINPKQGVDLMMGGQKVGRGEVMSLGDVLGVRVIERS